MTCEWAEILAAPIWALGTLMLGATLGMLIVALCVVAKRADEGCNIEVKPGEWHNSPHVKTHRRKRT